MSGPGGGSGFEPSNTNTPFLNISGDVTASQGILIPDDQFLRFGDSAEFTMEYDEDGTNYLMFKHNQNAAKGIEIKNEVAGNAASVNMYLRANSGGGALRASDDGVTSTEYGNKLALLTDNVAGLNIMLAARNASAEIQFYAGGDAAANKRMVIDTNSRISLSNNDNGTSNTVFGKSAGSSLSSGGNYNLILGEFAGAYLTTGDNNSLMGYNAGGALTTGSNNVAIGYSALASEQGGSGSIAIGSLALFSQNVSGSGIAVNQNIGIGNNAAYHLTTGSNNVAIGANAMYTNSRQHGCVAVGANSLFSMKNEGWDFDDFGGMRPSAGNTAVGEDAGYYLTTGLDNTFIGSRAGQGTSTGTGNYNTFVGSNAGSKITSATNNILIGAYAAANFYATASALTTGANNIVIGNQSEVQKANSNSSIVLGHGIQSTGDNDFDFGKVGNVVTNDFDTDAAWSRVSDVRKKRNIQDDRLGLEFINKLRTVTHQWIPSNELPEGFPDYNEENNMNLDITIHGMIAQEVKQALDEVGCDTFGGWKERTNGIQTLSREMFVIPLIKSVQELSAKVAELEDKLEDR